MAEIILENLTKQYGKVTAIDGISLKIDDGKAVVLLGPSGCGKTTLLRCIAGLEKITSGKILINGKLVNDLTPRERDLSMVFQNYALFPLMSAYDNIAFPLKIRGESQSEISARVKEVGKLLQIENLLEKMPRQLSGGEQQRVAIGRAISRRPEAFLLDEPLSNLDAPTRIQMRTELKKIQKELGVTTVYVTHDQSEAMVLGDKMGVMKSGKLLQYDIPDTVYSDPSNVFVAGFIGTPPMNLADVSLVHEASSDYLKGPGISYSIPPKLAQEVKSKIATNELVLGVRSEDLAIEKKLDPSALATGEVQLVDSLGAFVLVELKISDRVFFKISAGRDANLSVGDHISILLSNGKIHLFEKSSGNALIN